MSASMFTIGLMLKAYDDMSNVVNNAATKSIAAFGRVQSKIAEVSKNMEHMGKQAVGDALMLGGAMAAPLKAFADLDEASTNLKVAMMDNMGHVPALFAEINRQAVELGNALPGTTADFVNAATALIENGTGLQQVVGGGLRAASYLSVILKQPARDAAEMTAKFREAFGLTENQLVKMADLTQRAKFAFGLDPEEIKYAAQYSGATLNALHLTGIENAKMMLAFQGFARQRGMEGSVFGTNFASMLNQIGQMSSKLQKNSKPMQEVNKELKQYGIHLEFFDKGGKFLGLENLFTQLTKLRSLTEQQRLFMTSKLFGMEGGRVASMAIDMGPAGLQKNLAAMDRQADLMQRIDVVTKSAKNTWEAFTGTATNLMAALGQPMVEALQPFINKLNDLTGGPLMKWAEEHKTLVKWIGLTTLGVAGLLLALGTLGIVTGTVGRGISGLMLTVSWLGRALAATRIQTVALTAAQWGQTRSQALINAIAYRGGIWNALQFALLTTKYRTLELVGATRTWIVVQALSARGMLTSVPLILSFAGALGGRLVTALRVATIAVSTFSLSLLANPITWIALAIAAAAFLIWKYWKPLSGFFVGFWRGLQEGFAPLAPLFKTAGKLLEPVIAPLRAIWNWFARLFNQVEDTGGAAQSFGMRTGKMLASLVVEVFKLPGRFYDAGAAIMQGLWNGIKSFASHPLDAITNLGTKIAESFKSLLGIHSPSRVFMGYGLNIGEGAALGVQKSIPRLQGAVRGLAIAGATFAPMLGPVQAAPSSGGGSMVVHFSPQIHVHGGAQQNEQLKAGMDDAFRQFESLMRRYESERRRKGF